MDASLRFLPFAFLLGDLRFELLQPVLQWFKLLHLLLELLDLGGYVFCPRCSRMGCKSDHCNSREGLVLV
jgi:hypothetical protein